MRPAMVSPVWETLQKGTIMNKDVEAVSPGRRRVLRLAVAVALLASGCSSFRRTSDLDLALAELKQASTGTVAGADSIRLDSVIQRIKIRARELVAEHHEFADSFDQLLTERDVGKDELVRIVNSHAERREWLRNDLLKLQEELFAALPAEERDEVKAILNRSVGAFPSTIGSGA